MRSRGLYHTCRFTHQTAFPFARSSMGEAVSGSLRVERAAGGTEGGDCPWYCFLKACAGWVGELVGIGDFPAGSWFMTSIGCVSTLSWAKIAPAQGFPPALDMKNIPYISVQFCPHNLTYISKDRTSIYIYDYIWTFPHTKIMSKIPPLFEGLGRGFMSSCFMTEIWRFKSFLRWRILSGFGKSLGRPSPCM